MKREKILIIDYGSQFTQLIARKVRELGSYSEIIKKHDNSKYKIIAMSTLASGAIPAIEAYKFINSQKIDSVVFGASSKKNIKETVKLINI